MSVMVNLARWNTFEAVCESLNGLDVSVMKLGTERMARLMHYLGSPQDQVKTIHIVGTNGKGSTCALLESIYRAAGYQTGLFISPHLVDIRERIQRQGQPISQERFTEAAQIIAEAMTNVFSDPEDYLTYFEFINAMAFWLFAQDKVDIAIIEAGLGGRLDSTNVIARPEAVVVTAISEDHMDRLGHTLAQIATEKAGVFRPGSPVWTLAHQAPDVRGVLAKKAQSTGAPIQWVNSEHIVPGRMGYDGRRTFRLMLDEANQRQYFCGLTGAYQSQNLALALAVVSGLHGSLPITEAAIALGVEAVAWPGRFQRFPQWDLVVDGSHNKAGLETLLDTLRHDFWDTPVLWGLSLLNNRDPELLAPLAAYPKTIGVHWLNAQPGSRFHHPESLAQAIPCDKITIGTQIQTFATLPIPTGVLKIITGSLYTAGTALRVLAKPNA